jgi:dihydrofolate reductase
MRRLILWMVVTADGYIAGPDGALDAEAFIWDEEMQDFVNGYWGKVETMVFGRSAYAAIAPWWDAIADGTAPPDAPVTAADLTFARHLKGMERIVVTHRAAVPGGTVLTGGVPDGIRDLKRRQGSDILLACGPGLVAQLARDRLIDEVILLVGPIALGRGISLFAELDRVLPLRLLETKAFRSGMVLLRYEITFDERHADAG